MSTSNQTETSLSGEVDLIRDQEIFDALPKKLRDVLNTSRYNFSAESIAKNYIYNNKDVMKTIMDIQNTEETLIMWGE